ncbi:MAG: O-antigen ligase family protein [Lachnospiraceae bacterium]|nr:O-antigen ligase family protein [Lachnospiraceae bacterium]
MKIRFVRGVGIQEAFTFCFCFFLVLYIFNGYEFGAPFEYTIIPISIVFLVSLFTKHKYDVKSFLLVLLLILLGIVSTLSSNIINFTQSRVLTFSITCVVCIWIGDVYINEKYMNRILSFYVAFSFIIVAMIIAGYLFGFGVDSHGRASINYGDFFKDQNYLSAFFLPAFSIAFYRIIYSEKGKIRNSVFCILSLFAVFIMSSRGSFLTILLITAFVIGKMILVDKSIIKKVVLIGLLLVAVIVIYNFFQSLPMFQRMMNFESYGSDVRLRLWAAGFNGFFYSPLIGSGIGSASEYSWRLVGNAVHNSFIEFIADQGILGAVVVLLILLRIFMRKREKRFFISILMISFFVPLFFLTGYTNFTFWMPVMFISLIATNSIECKS